MKIAVIQIRGLVGSRQEVKDTMKMLNLQKKNSCVIIDKNPQYIGMLEKVADYITYGEVDEETIKLLEPRKKQKQYALNPPRKGFERKGIKVRFNQGGALGNRGKEINSLIKRMI
jgi:large subunit ribosomal protein L30